jgi:hypothetical protein
MTRVNEHLLQMMRMTLATPKNRQRRRDKDSFDGRSIFKKRIWQITNPLGTKNSCRMPAK